jgi:endonuclease YncB( thermonuclease family)
MSEKLIEYLNSCNKKNTNKFCFKDCIKTVKVVDVYDGDTVTVLLNIDPKEEDLSLIYKFKVRMYGYNS